MLSKKDPWDYVPLKPPKARDVVYIAPPWRVNYDLTNEKIRKLLKNNQEILSQFALRALIAGDSGGYELVKRISGALHRASEHPSPKEVE